MDKQNTLNFEVAGGAILAILGAAVAIAICINFTRTGTPLLAIILLIWGLTIIRDSAKKNDWQPFVIGSILGLGYTSLGIAASFLQESSLLWGMILINLLSEELTNTLTPS